MLRRSQFSRVVNKLRTLEGSERNIDTRTRIHTYTHAQIYALYLMNTRTHTHICMRTYTHTHTRARTYTNNTVVVDGNAMSIIITMIPIMMLIMIAWILMTITSMT